MCERFSDLRCREVINVCDGSRLGYPWNLELDLETGRVVALVVPGPGRFFGLFRGREEYVIPWRNICKIGDDIVLVDAVLDECRRTREKEGFRW